MNVEDFAESSAWLKREHLEEGSITAEIISVSQMKGKFGMQLVLETKEFKYSMSKGHPNVGRLIKGFGKDADQWVGSAVEFSADSYPDTNSGEMKETIKAMPVGIVEGGQTVHQAKQSVESTDNAVKPAPQANLDLGTNDLPF